MYLINRLVEFSPENQSLSNRVTGKVVQLQTPANQCLLYLLSQQGQVVSQHVLMKAGWGDRNEVTTPNTFYQTILLLRNALVEAGLSRDTIRTLSRRGLILDDRVTVEAITSSAQSRIVIENTVPSEQKKKFRGMTAYICGIIIMLTFIVWQMLAYRLQPPFKSFVPASDLWQSNKQCHLYTANDEMTLSYYAEFIRKYAELCENNHYVFISGFRHSERMVAFVCGEDPRKMDNALCSTHYYWQWKS